MNWYLIGKIVVVALVYCNIGWALGTYFHNTIEPRRSADQVTLWDIMLGAGFAGKFLTEHNPRIDQILFMLFWPILFFVSTLLVVIVIVVLVVLSLAYITRNFLPAQLLTKILRL